MQLEKSQTGEAGLAGWISSNDVTLFTMVLVVVVALFLHTRLIRGKSENEELSGRNAELRAQNQQIEDQLGTTSNLLSTTRDNLDQTRDELAALDAELQDRKRRLAETQQNLQMVERDRTQLNADLSAALDRISRLGKNIEDLTAEKNKIESDLTAQLQQTRETLEGDKADLTKNLNAVVGQLEQKVQALRDAENQRDRLREQADNLDALVATLQKKLNVAAEDMDKLKSQHTAQLDQMEKQTQAETARAADYMARLQRAAEMLQGLQLEKRNLQTQVSDLKEDYNEQVARGVTISRELVGIKGDLKRVAFVFDASGSMKQRGTSEEDRWREAQQIAATWLAHMDVDECVLIVFSTRVGAYPADRTFIPVSGPEGAANRQLLLNKLNAVEPRGVTNTLDALRVAYTYPGLDTIVLFSDGAPSSATSGEFDPQIAEQIYQLCRQHTDIPINTIGLGDYFDREMGTFLRNLAHLTGGTFRGR